MKIPIVQKPCIPLTGFKVLIKKQNLNPNKEIHYIISNQPVTVGQKYGCNMYVSEILYKPKKWWMFWKKKEQIGFHISHLNGGDSYRRSS